MANDPRKTQGSPPAPDRSIDAIEGPQEPNRGGYDPLAINELMSRLQVPGMSIAVVHDFCIHWVKSYGLADCESGMEVDVDTLFQGASTSKVICAVALVKAAQDGLLSLDDDINSVLRSWQLTTGEFTKKRSVTARLLASHTSGLGDSFGFPGYMPDATLPTMTQILNGEAPSIVGAVCMQYPPLEVFKYSGGGSVILQLALEDIYRGSFSHIAREAVFEPIEMTDSTFEQPLSPGRDRKAARGHDSDVAMRAKWFVYPELAAAGLWTTAADLARLVIEVQKSVHGHSNRVLSRTSVQEMLSPVGIGDYGVGFQMAKHGEGWYFGHGGTNRGFTCTRVDKVRLSDRIRRIEMIVRAFVERSEVTGKEGSLPFSLLGVS